MFYLAKNTVIAGSPENFNEWAADHTDGQSISGVQRKLMMKFADNKLIPTANGGQYIVKPAPEEAPNLPENEYFVMQLAKKVGFDVSDCGFLPFESGELTYVTSRFDTIDETTRLYVEDGASLCNVHPKNKCDESLSYESVLNQLKKCAGGSKALVLNLFLQVVYSYTVGNNDLHLKNFSLTRKPSSKSNLMQLVAPMYDMLSISPYKKFDLLCFMSIGVLKIEEGEEGDFSEAHDYFGFYTRNDFVQLGLFFRS